MNISTHVYEANLDDRSDRKRFFENTGIVNQTDFFRREDLFRELTEVVLPELGSRQPKINLLNIWSAGCSDGREPYSIAMTVERWLSENPGTSINDYHIRASDLNSEHLATARRGLYALKKKERYLLQPFADYFQFVTEDQILISSRLKRRTSFYDEDITVARRKQRYQLIICTNVLMYYEKEFRKSIIAGLINSLDKDGYLFIESVGTKAMKNLGLMRLSSSSHFFLKTESNFKE